MAKRFPPLDDQIRAMIRDCGFNQNRLSVMLDIDRASLSRFMRSERGLGWTHLNRLTGFLGLKVTSHPPAKTKQLLKTVKRQKRKVNDNG